MNTSLLLERVRDIFSKNRRTDGSSRAEKGPTVFFHWKTVVLCGAFLAGIALAISIFLFLSVDEKPEFALGNEDIGKKRDVLTRADVEKALSAYTERKAAFEDLLANPPVFVDPSR